MSATLAGPRRVKDHKWLAYAVLTTAPWGIPAGAEVSVIERAMDIGRRWMGPRRPENVTIARNPAALPLKAVCPNDAAKFGGNAISTFEETLGVDSPRMAAAAAIHVSALQAKGDNGSTQRMYRRVVAYESA